MRQSSSALRPLLAARDVVRHQTTAINDEKDPAKRNTKKKEGKVVRNYASAHTQVAPEPPVQVVVPTTMDTTPNPEAQKYQSVDGSYATSHVAYALSDAAFIYPITPSSAMGEFADVWMAQGVSINCRRKNAFEQVVDVREMQSEAGAAGALHGALAAGALATTFTASQGLLLMIPNMYKIAGELLPSVIHVSAREVAGQALCIFGGHSDVMAVRQTGWAMLSSHTVQQAHDMALIAHIATLKSNVPFVHFFDGFRTSHEVNKIKLMPAAEMKKLIPPGSVERHWSRALNPTHPTLRGTSQGSDIFFQCAERTNIFYDGLAEIVQETMDEAAPHLGRHYKIFEYAGDADAEDVVVIMGSGSTTTCEAVDHLRAQGRKVGALMVHLYRPWSADLFEKALPKSVKRIAVMDRCREVTAMGEPLYLDVLASVGPVRPDVKIIGGKYGLGSKEFTPEQALAIYDYLADPGSKHRFTVGINDDVNMTSIPYWDQARVDTVPEGTRQCIFWGLGSDGTVGANRSAVKIIGDNSDLMVQAYFAFDAFKSGGVTSSHLRFGPQPITAQYLITNADYIACHFQEYVRRFTLLDQIKDGGTFVLNTRWSADELEKYLPARIRRQLAEKKVKFYIVDARKICDEFGLGKRINMLMQAIFFKLSGVLPLEQADRLLKDSIQEEYGKKGAKVVEMNQAVVEAVNSGTDIPTQIEIPASWANASDDAPKTKTGDEFVDVIMRPMMDFQGDKLPVSVFTPGGVFPVGTTKYGKRAIAAFIPQWLDDKCTQCNYCSYVCPHAAIRPFVLTDQEAVGAPEAFVTRKAKGDYQGMQYRIQVAPEDCTGCSVCVETCPDDALVMTDAVAEVPHQKPNWDFAMSLPSRGHMTDRNTVKGSQFQQPLLEFSGACEGCGETPYIKLITQLFGERMIIANATGCSSIWGGTASQTPYTKNDKGHGPAWGNSLFEDNAEFGFGLAVANAQRRAKLVDIVQEALDSQVGSESLRKMLSQWMKDKNTGDKCARYMDDMLAALEEQQKDSPLLENIYAMKSVLPNISQWIVGGDGWANDIGFGGLDHVLASGQNVNVFVLDTEMYSNTGGQASKSSNMASVAKYALGGKKSNKKPIGEMAMLYGNVYVATVSHANMAQCVKALVEAESYDGPSIVVGYAPCIEHGMRTGMARMVQESEVAVDSGYWPLYRFDPRLEAQGKNPFQLDSKRIKASLMDFLKSQNRYVNLQKTNPKGADLLRGTLQDHVTSRFNKYKRMQDAHKLAAAAGPSGNQVTILFGSETGNSESLAKELGTDFERRDYAVNVQALDDIDPAEIADMGFVVICISTCGQGAFPRNSQLFWQDISRDKPEGWLKNLKYAVFGLGDSTYYFYCHTAKLIDARLAELGAQRVSPIGFGDDGDEDAFHTGFGQWIPGVWSQLGTKTPEETLFEPSISVEHTPDEHPGKFHWAASQPVASMTGAVRITPETHSRNFITIKWKTDMPYQVGDSLGIYPENDREVVEDFLKGYGLNASDVVTITNNGTRELPQCISLSDLFTTVLDILGKPNHRFYSTLAHFALDKAEKERLVGLGQQSEEYSKMLAETAHYVDILNMFPSARPPLQYLIEMVPNIKPRYYSITSAPIDTPGEVHSLVLIDTWLTLSGKHRTGLTCTMLEKLEKDQVVDGCIHPTAMEFHDHEKPLVMCAMGSGLAPFVAMLRERTKIKQQGKKVGACALYFGNRYKASEFLMEEELMSYVNDGLLTLRTAFSRDDPKKKVYVQDLVAGDAEMMHDYLVKQGGAVYCCGARSFIKPVQEALKAGFVKAGGMDEAAAEDQIVQMFTTGRYNIEAW